MEIKVIAGNIAEIKAGAIVVDLLEGTECLSGDIAGIDSALGGAILRLIKQGEIKGKLNEVTLVHSLGRLPAARLAVVGLGKQSELSLDKVRGAVAEACRLLRHKGCASIATIALGAGVAGITPEAAAQAVTEGARLGLYSFRRHITKEAEYGEIGELTVVAAGEAELTGLEWGCAKGRTMAEATNRARDMANEPANYMTPVIMAETAKALAEDCGLEINVLEEEQMKELGMGALLGVARGSREPARFIILNYRGSDAAGLDIALVGKGITFDSGGISIKPSEKMDEMKGDMAGGGCRYGGNEGARSA